MAEHSDLNDPQVRINAEKIWRGQDERIPVWLDCDTGHDDAFAVLLAAQCPRLNLLGISTVHGNASLENTTRNTLSVLEAIKRRDVPVFPGAAKPFCREAVHAVSIHGESGLDGTTLLPKPAIPAQSHEFGAIGAMYTALSTHPGAWIVATGALTNVGLLFAVYPQLAQSVGGLSIMGGAVGGFFTHAPMGKLSERLQLKKHMHRDFPRRFPDDSEMTIEEVARHFRKLGILEGTEDLEDERVHLLLEQARVSFGNQTEFAEFNIYCDPEAAYSIFSNSVLAAKTTLIPLDLTHQVLGNEEVLKLLRYGDLANKATSSSQSTVRGLFLEIITYFAATYEKQFAMTDGPPLHDPVAVAAVFAPEIFDDLDGERYEIYVVRHGDDSALDHRRRAGKEGQCGRTILETLPKGAAGVRVPRTLHVGEFWHLVDLAIQSVPE